MKWPTIPENLSELSATELRELADQIRAARKANVGDLSTQEEFDEYDTWGDREKRISALADDAAAEEALAAAEEAAAEEAEEVEVEEEAATTEPEVEEVEVVATEVVTTIEVETSIEEIELEPAGSGWFFTQDGASALGLTAGAEAADFTEIAAAIAARADTLQEGSDVKHVIAQQKANFPSATELSENPYFNYQMLQDEQEIQAAMCAPLTPLYDTVLACANTMRRPVAASLPNFRLRADRGGFTVYPAPSLHDITGGYGQWTSTDDVTPESVKDCATITCSSPVEYEIYGVYRCLTVKHLIHLMTFPEIVEAYLNRLGAAWARFAETLLLEAMGNGSTTLNTYNLGYGGTTTVLSTVLNYLDLYREVERWDDGQMDAWMPRWVMGAIKTDLMRRRRTDGGKNMVASDAEVNALFSNVGVTPHWYMDRPSWATPVPPLATNGVLNLHPRSLEILVAPRGKFALMDRGNLNIGVSGNNQYRVDDDLLRNQIRFFFESFEGVIDTNTCPAHILQIDTTCWNGVQIDDQVLGCIGEDVAGVGS